jgi:mRNA-decapping enzyme subunit 2
VYGAVIMNIRRDKLLLVTDVNNRGYSFPKGKVNQNENGLECAVREVWEEIGFYCQNYISEEVIY